MMLREWQRAQPESFIDDSNGRECGGRCNEGERRSLDASGLDADTSST